LKFFALITVSSNSVSIYKR